MIIARIRKGKSNTEAPDKILASVLLVVQSAISGGGEWKDGAHSPPFSRAPYSRNIRETFHSRVYSHYLAASPPL